MATTELLSLIPIATRLHLDSTSYSNALPAWIDPITVDYRAVEAKVARRLEGYVAGERPRQRPFEVLVPAKKGDGKRWLLPPVNDQIILQACAWDLAGRLAEKGIPDPDRAFSYRLNRDPNQLLLTASQIVSWAEFQSETRKRLEASPYLLQLDLERAFPSIDRGRFLSFLRKTAPGGDAVDVLRTLLDEAVVPEPGLPMVNDALCYLGNAYLSTVDDLFRRHTDDFIRFVDDYRVFGPSRQALEGVLENISRDLRPLGFRVNSRKLRLGTSQEYLEAVSGLKHSRLTEDGDSYISATIFTDVVEPGQMAQLIERALLKPDEYLNEGIGRFILGAIRRMRLNSQVASEKGYNLSPEGELEDLLDERGLAGRAFELLQKYAPSEDTAWRAVWLVYLMEGFPVLYGYSDSDLPARLSELAASQNLPDVVRLWLKRLLAPFEPERPFPNEVEVFEQGYLEAGRLCYGRET